MAQTRDPQETPDGFRWVTCAKDLEWNVSRYRHLIGKHHASITTVCGATGMPANVWRGNSTKPECPDCISLAGITPKTTQ